MAARFRLSRRQDLQFKTGSAWISKIESLLDHGSDVAVLENQPSGLPCFADGNFHHRARQVVGRNHLIGEQRPKQRVDCAQQPVAEVRFLPGFHGIDNAGRKM